MTKEEALNLKPGEKVLFQSPWALYQRPFPLTVDKVVERGVVLGCAIHGTNYLTHKELFEWDLFKHMSKP